jgi:hypothetical protein
MRLRTTAFPIARGTVKPILGPSACGSQMQKAANSGLEKRVPPSYTLRKSFDRSRRTRFGNPEMAVLPLGTDSELLAAARASAGKHGTAILGFHATTESVRLRAVAIIRLKGTFRHFSSNMIINQAGKPGQIALSSEKAGKRPAGT